MLIDIGVNLTNNRFERDLPDVLSRAKDSNVGQIIVTGTNVKESQQALLLCQQEWPIELYCTVGVHPHDADHVSDSYLDHLATLAAHKNVVAIGECGLDFNRNFSTPAGQEKVFTQQLQLASDIGKPVFLHQRDAFPRWQQLLKPFTQKISGLVSHCFTGSYDELMATLDLGCYIGITGWVCDERRGRDLFDIVKHIPLDRLMIETDAPYLTPRTIKPKPKSSRNEPAYLPYVLKQVALAYELPEHEIAGFASDNSRRVFGLPES